jgi:hypothetical protein
MVASGLSLVPGFASLPEGETQISLDEAEETNSTAKSKMRHLTDMRSLTTPSLHLSNVVRDDKAPKVRGKRGRAVGKTHVKNMILIRPAPLPFNSQNLVILSRVVQEQKEGAVKDLFVFSTVNVISILFLNNLAKTLNYIYLVYGTRIFILMFSIFTCEIKV